MPSSLYQHYSHQKANIGSYLHRVVAYSLQSTQQLRQDENMMEQESYTLPTSDYQSQGYTWWTTTLYKYKEISLRHGSPVSTGILTSWPQNYDLVMVPAAYLLKTKQAELSYSNRPYV